VDSRTAPNTAGPIRRITTDTVTRLAGGGVNLAALARAVELHHHGYLTRREIERAFGAPYGVLAAAARARYWRLS